MSIEGADRAADYISTADDLSDLRSIFDVDSSEAAYQAAKTLWWHHKTDMPVQDAGLPDTSVTVEDTTYHTYPVPHGMMHDGEPLLPKWAVVEHVQSYVADWTAEGHDVYTEENVDTVFELSNAEALDDREWLYNTHLDEPDPSELRDEEFGDQVVNGTDLEDTDPDALETPADLYRAALSDPDALPAYEQACQASSLPEPLERDYWEDKDREQWARRCERSRHMADTLVDENTADTVHLLVGGGHYTGVVHRFKEYGDGDQ